ncbi:phosphoketolase [Candidatus Peregrinibacteria bacterium]|nr:phosphoketolase [Candidatus Peregrinibacteria bacterium]
MPTKNAKKAVPKKKTAVKDKKAKTKKVAASKKTATKPKKNNTIAKKTVKAEKKVVKTKAVKKAKSKKVVPKSELSFSGCELDKKTLQWFKDYHAYVNYVGAASLYLKDNFLLKRKLKKDDIKDRVLGHWGTVPGLNFIYAHCNYIISKYKQKSIFVTGPGHGAPANLANNFVDGSMGEKYKKYSRDLKGMGAMMKDFSWPYGLPSHVTPDVPGSILEGGELGYSLSTAFGAAMDNPDLMVFCVVGDGEAETGPLATAWHSNKFLNPKESGAVLPIVHVNGYKISGPSIYSTMTDQELSDLFHGYGYEPLFVVDKEENLHQCMANAMEKAYQMIKDIQKKARKENCVTKTKWPMIIFRSMKGWTGTEKIGDKKIEDNYLSHGIPLKNVKKDKDEFEALEEWLKSYQINKLVDQKGKPAPKVLKNVPKGALRMGMVKEANGGEVMKKLAVPKIEKYEYKNGERGQVYARSTKIMAEWLSELMVQDAKKNKIFRFFCPDETDSNKFGKLLHTVGREYVWPVKPGEECIVSKGRVSEMLSEHTLQGWLQGYNLTGRHGLFVTYESFAMINASMVDQHLKFIKQAKRVKWRKPIPSLNYILSSVEWRQEHNGYSHQNPSFISNILEKHSELSSCYFPADGNTLLAVMEHCFGTTDRVNVIAAGKQEMPQWQSVAEAKKQLKNGISIWDWIDKEGAKNPDAVFATAGDYMVEEMMAAIDILRNEFPDFKIRFVNILEMTANGFGNHKKTVNGSTHKEFYKYFTEDKPVIFNFHGYPNLMKKMLWGLQDDGRYVFNGYMEEGSTTTPFDMHYRNGTSRFHVIIQAMQMAGINSKDKKFSRKAWNILKKYQKKLDEHKKYVEKYGIDLPEVVDWRWGK